jgi:hypothetical protein
MFLLELSLITRLLPPQAASFGESTPTRKIIVPASDRIGIRYKGKGSGVARIGTDLDSSNITSFEGISVGEKVNSDGRLRVKQNSLTATFQLTA